MAVNTKQFELKDYIFYEHVMSVSLLRKYISKLKCGCAPGADGVMTEHLKYATGTRMIHYLSLMFSLCFKYGVIPVTFLNGLIIPLLKKPTLDPAEPKNYRPITLSCTLSKILELYILDVSDQNIFNDLQFGFISGRGTTTAASLANDVICYCNKRGSPVFTCALDAEGAFDVIPHDILFSKSIDVIPDHCWLILVNWYRNINVQIKWVKSLSPPIKVCKGTRQGGISSPYLFNLFYKDMINELSSTVGGLSINNLSFNVLCYADDVMLASLTVTGLQNMINIANRYITDHGLRY